MWNSLHGQHSIVLSKTLKLLDVVGTVDDVNLCTHWSNVSVLWVQASSLDRDNIRDSLRRTEDFGAAVTTEIVMVQFARVAQVRVGSGLAYNLKVK